MENIGNREAYIAELREQLLILSDRAAQHIQRITELTKENMTLKEQLVRGTRINASEVGDKNV